MQTKFVIFTDLDGTLLDSDTYEFKEALPAISYLQQLRIPIVPCTSKTHLEVKGLRNKLKLNDPFIVENGSAIFFEKGYFKNTLPQKEIDGFGVKILGKSHQEIIAFLNKLKHVFNLKLKGFSEMHITEIQALTNLPPKQAQLAQKRYFSEPMISFEKDDFLKNTEIINFVTRNGFKILRGNRFYHLIGNCDKGRAVKELIQMFKKEFYTSLITIGLGDSKNDYEMLKAVQFPIIIRKKDGNFVHLEGLGNTYITDNAGPAGWSEAIFKFVKPNETR